ncbi:MAG: phosphate ABC transporter substrate-binding protein PstS [FCB group bacterium]
MKKIIFFIFSITLLGYLITSNTEIAKSAPPMPDNVEILGAGATFPFPLYSKMFDEYNKSTNIKVNYQAIGSGGGIRQLNDKTVDFGATDAFMDAKELTQAGAPIVHFPMCLGAVCVTYNLPGIPKLKFTGDVVADIFAGKITKWNDSRITKLNSGIKLPSSDIVVVHRSDGSGTTFIFSDYLTKVSQTWANSIGTGKSLNWPVGLGGKGNQGVAGLVQQTPGSIGYVELVYSKSNNMPVALIKNKSGNFIEPSIKSTSLAANVNLPADTRTSLTNTDAAQGYPISSFTWIIIYKELKYGNITQPKAKALVNLINWMLHTGQKFAEPLYYSPLPKEAVRKSEALLKTITYGGKPLL